MNVRTIREVISDASEMGYKVVSFSGGEPLMYEHVDEILHYAKSKGMITSLTTNGTLLENERISKLKGCLDLIAISLDGPREIHNKMRRSSNAFRLLQTGLSRIKKVNLKFGFIHTLTRESWEHLNWITNFAIKHGASLLQIHPLELFGRAKTLSSVHTTDDILARAFLLTTVLSAKYASMIKIQLDVLHRDVMITNPELIYASNLQIDPDAKPSYLLSNIVVEASGKVVPVSYGLSNEFSICNVNNNRLKSGWNQYVQYGGYEKFRSLCRKVYGEISTSNDLPLFNWYDMVVSRSYHYQQ